MNAKICANCFHDKVHHNLLTGCMEMDNKGGTRHPKYEQCRCKDFEEIRKKDNIDLGKINAPSASDEGADRANIGNEASDAYREKAEGKGVGRTTETRPDDAADNHCSDCSCKLGKCDCVCCDLNSLCIASRKRLE